jgi:hypothetical protein
MSPYRIRLYPSFSWHNMYTLLAAYTLTEKGFSPPQAVGLQPRRLGVVALARASLAVVL